MVVSGKKNKDAPGYATAWEHYGQEWARLDLRLAILMKLMEEPDAPADPSLLPFKGLVLTEEEMHRLLYDGDDREEDAELAELRRQLAAMDRELARKRQASLEQGGFLPVPYVSQVFGLNEFEEQTLLMALALETDRKYEKLYAYVQDDATSKYLTPELAMRLYGLSGTDGGGLLKFFMNGSRLQEWFFRGEGRTAEQANGPLLTRPLRLDERMTAFLLGIGYTDVSLRQCIRLYEADSDLPDLETGRELQERLRAFAEQRTASDPLPVFCLWGQPGAGKKLQTRHAAAHWDKPLLVANVESMLRDERPFSELIVKVLREGMLYGSVVAFDRFHLLWGEDEGIEKKRMELLDRLQSVQEPLFLLSEQAWNPRPLQGRKLFLEAEVPIPETAERRKLWESWSAERRLEHAADWGAVAGKFRFSPGQIAASLDYAVQLLRWNGSETNRAGESDTMYRACYAQVQHSLKKKAVRIEPKYDWDRVILPPEQKEQLKHACARLQYRGTVLGDWGFDRALAYGKGVSLLFAGPPGTGKTMSAQVLAKEVQLEIYKIDLSQVISKYIGETEKNLHEVFSEAQLSNAILFFDEADALFGKRSEVKDSNDKYSNVETAYLLQKMEEYDGITILATNLQQNLDEAFMRRFGFIVKFPFPDAGHREQIWRGLLPSEAPVEDDIDFRFLASQFELTGGYIKNIVLSAAFMAAEQRCAIGMKQLMLAARNELRKNGKIWIREEMGEYADLFD